MPPPSAGSRRHGAPPLDPHNPLPRLWATGLKRAVDYLLAAILLALGSPILLLTALAVKLTSRGPAIYSQTRLGYRGRPYRIFKLRTMYHNCEQLTGPRWCVPGDPRVTPVGRFLRRTHLDELPQLWNVLRGEMSLVGPRPERPEIAGQLEKVIPLYGERLLVRPGVTGLAQVQLPPDTDLDSVRRKLAYDLYYVRTVSLWLDLTILLSTAFHVLGVSFAVPQRLFGVPSGPPVEGSYERRAREAEPRLQMQAVN
jgi:lipopolysaccharide/colanic/teichoic acid biosynthesis glycosyltransferase